MPTTSPAPRYSFLGEEVVVLKSKNIGKRPVSRRRSPRRVFPLTSLGFFTLDEPETLVLLVGTGALS